MKTYVSTKLLPNPTLKSFLDSAVWQGNTLVVKSKFGHGTINLKDNLVEIDIELSFFGSLAKGRIESTLDNEMKKLNS
ncbi:MAG: polyhydroxyalkanoic acid system family protein [Chloroflexota bacterium]